MCVIQQRMNSHAVEQDGRGPMVGETNVQAADDSCTSITPEMIFTTPHHAQSRPFPAARRREHLARVHSDNLSHFPLLDRAFNPYSTLLRSASAQQSAQQTTCPSNFVCVVCAWCGAASQRQAITTVRTMYFALESCKSFLILKSCLNYFFIVKLL